jgi:hypothetical protein
VSGGTNPPFSISALVGGKWSASRPCRFTAADRGPGSHWIGGWLGPRSGLDTVDKRTCLRWESNPGCPAASIVELFSDLHEDTIPHFRSIVGSAANGEYFWDVLEIVKEASSYSSTLKIEEGRSSESLVNTRLHGVTS